MAKSLPNLVTIVDWTAVVAPLSRRILVTFKLSNGHNCLFYVERAPNGEINYTSLKGQCPDDVRHVFRGINGPDFDEAIDCATEMIQENFEK